MHAFIPAATIHEIIALARTVMAPSTMPILQHVRLTVPEGEHRVLIMDATDLDIQITRRFTLPDPALPGAVCLPLAGLAKIRPDKRTEVTLAHVEKSRVRVAATSGGVAVTSMLDCLEADQFPAFDPPPDRLRKILPQATLQAIAASIPFQSGDQTRYVLNGCLLDPNHVVATDGRRMLKTDVRGTPVPVIIPTKTCRVLAALNAITAVAELAPGNDPNTITLRLGPDTVILSKLIDGNYPNWRVVIPDTSARTITFADPEPVKKFLRRLDSKSRNATVRLTPLPPCQLELSHPDATLVTAACFTGEPEPVCFNPAFLAECLQAAGNTFSQECFGAPAMFNAPGAIAILMPMRGEAAAPAESEQSAEPAAAAA